MDGLVCTSEKGSHQGGVGLVGGLWSVHLRKVHIGEGRGWGTGSGLYI